MIILARLLPAYLEDLRQSAVEGRLEERKLIHFLDRLLAIVTARSGRKVFAELKIDAGKLFSDLNPDKLPKLKAFLEKRLHYQRP